MEITTERLCLRPFRAADLPAFVAYRSRPEVARYQGWEAGYSMADAEQFFDEQRGAEWGGAGWLQLAAVDRQSGTLYGDCAVRVDGQTAELGVTLAPEHQGRGIATEALAAVIAQLRSDGVARIFAETDERNESVHRLFERLGFEPEPQQDGLRIYATGP